MSVTKNHWCSFFKFYEMNAFDINAAKISISFILFLRLDVLLIEDITRWREDMNFIFEWQNNIGNILFLPRENKIHIFKPPCNVLYIK